MSDPDLCYLGALEALAAFRNRQLSPVAYLEALIARSEQVNPKINAWTYTFFERALAEAKAAEGRYLGKGNDPRPLDGLPVAIKDDHAVANEITTHGSRLFENNVYPFDSPHVARIREAGAILYARTTTPEFAAATICHSPLWGVTRNPWNLATTPGGSGGGAGAALAAGMVPLCDGGDYGGSIRIPASLNGLVGYRPPSGRVPGAGAWLWNAWSTQGPMARSVGDAALLYNLIAGPDLRDPTTVPGHPNLPESFQAIEGWRVAVSEDLGLFKVEPEIRAAFREAVQAFAELGCTVEQVEIPWTLEREYEAAISGYKRDGEELNKNFTEEQKALISTHLRHIDQWELGRGGMTVEAVNEVRAGMWGQLREIFERCEVLLTPTTGTTALAADIDLLKDEVRIEDTPVDSVIGWALCWPFNVLERLPAISVPMGRAANGVPLGLQIIGKPYDDLSVFRAAAAFEAARPWVERPEM
ncbi:MAG: amidase [Rhodovibrionaceae bacterium]